MNSVIQNIDQDADEVFICGEKRVINPLMETIESEGIINSEKIKLEQWF